MKTIESDLMKAAKECDNEILNRAIALCSGLLLGLLFGLFI